MALTQGANERILDERKSMFPYTDQQAQRFVQVYRDLKCNIPSSHFSLSLRMLTAWRNKNRCTLRPGPTHDSARPRLAHLARDDQNRDGPRAVPLRDERGPSVPRHRRRRLRLVLGRAVVDVPVARAPPARPRPLLPLLQRAQDVQGQARGHASKGARLPPRFSRVDEQLARGVVRLESARHRIRLVRF